MLAFRTYTMATGKFTIGLSRAAAGALLFSLPMLLTMEMWWMGFTIQPYHAAVLLVVMFPILIGLAYYSGFEPHVTWLGAAMDAFVAYAIAVIVCLVVLFVLAIIRPPTTSWNESVGAVIMQAIAASFGAVLARSQMGADSSTDLQPNNKSLLPENAHNSLRCYLRELFLMLAGAIFLALNVAPTEEMVLVSFQMTAWHGIAAMFLSILIMHGFVYTVKFHGHETPSFEHSAISVFLRFTVAGYAISLMTSYFLLWSFGRLDDTGFDESLMACVVLGVPTSVGAAAARLIL